MFIYNLDGTIKPFNSPIPIFRKMTTNAVELYIATKLMKNPHPNIVTVYNVTSTYFDMELLQVDYTINSSIVEKMQIVKSYLQSLNIAYIDWKPDNIGLDSSGEPKLFDFDGCGLFLDDIWLTLPFPGYAYKEVSKIETNPAKIDDVCFAKYLK